MQINPSFMKCFPALFSVLFLLSNTLFSQNTGWTASPFGTKVFIENKGQFNEKMANGKWQMADGNTYLPAGMASTILFGASSEGVELYFSVNGLTYRHNEIQQLSEEGEKEERKKIRTVPHYVHMEWVGFNPHAKIIRAEPVSYYFTYGDTRDSTGKSSIKASAYKKIIYKNIYPNIDVEYVFPSDSIGIKYSIILRPGANPSDIKMKYEHAENIFLDPDGNAVIKSSFGEFIDHAPVTFFEDSKEKISSSFTITENIISFLLPVAYYPLPARSLIIDPWITNPAFTGYNAAYDVNYDMNGNVYIFGSYSPFKLAKLDSTGAIQWTFNATGLGGGWYGDFAVDEVSGTSYLVGGISIGTSVLKINTLGLQTGTLPGDTTMNEMWRAEYNRCVNKIVIAAGGTKGPYHAAMLDTNMVNITPVNVLSNTPPDYWKDMSLLAIDNNSNFCYMATSKSSVGTLYDNVLIKCPVPSLVPISFSVFDGHKINEVASIRYVNPSGFLCFANGMNGMAVSRSWLYTYDSDSLKRWDKNTGTLIAGIDVSPLPPVYGTGVFYRGIQVFWGGISVDECENIYVGLQSSVCVYDSSLSLVNTFPLPDSVYDVKLGPNNKLYACGQGFATEIDVTHSVMVTQTPASGCGLCDGTATVNAICGNLSGFNYSWNTSPVQTTQTATGLCPGNYAVTVTAPVTNCSNGFAGTGTVTITGGSGALSATVTAAPAACNNNNGSATVIITGGTAPYTYLWFPSGGTNATATGLAAGTYTVIITDASGCTGTQTVTVVLSGSITTSQSASLCFGSTYTLPGGTVVSTGGIYNDTLTSANGCDSIIMTNLTVNPNPTANAFSNVTITQGQSVTLTASGGGTYSWSNGTNGSSITVTPLVTTIYCVTVTDLPAQAGANGCTDTACVTVTIEPIDCSFAGELFFPNAFSPNGDGENDKLQIHYADIRCIKTSKLIIYNRWGEKVFETADAAKEWDGFYKGKLLNTAVFVYYLEATLIGGERIVKKGNISLLR